MKDLDRQQELVQRDCFAHCWGALYDCYISVAVPSPLLVETENIGLRSRALLVVMVRSVKPPDPWFLKVQ